jgi:hypothetical protein
MPVLAAHCAPAGKSASIAELTVTLASNARNALVSGSGRRMGATTRAQVRSDAASVTPYSLLTSPNIAHQAVC